MFPSRASIWKQAFLPSLSTSPPTVNFASSSLTGPGVVFQAHQDYSTPAVPEVFILNTAYKPSFSSASWGNSDRKTWTEKARLEVVENKRTVQSIDELKNKVRAYFLIICYIGLLIRYLLLKLKEKYTSESAFKEFIFIPSDILPK